MTKNPLLEKEVEAIDGNNINPGDPHAGLHNAINAVYEAGYNTADDDGFSEARTQVFIEVRNILTQALERVWKEGTKAGGQFENGAWMMGIRCTNCGGEKNEDLSDMCGKCFEEA